MPGPTERFASVEQQEQFLRRTSLPGEEPTDDLPEAHIEEVIDKDLDPPDGSGPDEPPPNKGKGRAEGERPNNNPPDGGDDGNGPGGSDDSSDSSDGSEAHRNSAIARSIRKGLSGLFTNIDDDKETARTSNPEPFDGSDAKALNAFFTACATTFIGRPKAYKKQRSCVTYALSFLWGPAWDHFAPLISEADNTGIVQCQTLKTDKSAIVKLRIATPHRQYIVAM